MYLVVFGKEKSSFTNLWQINCLCGKFLLCGRIRFIFTKIFSNLVPSKNPVFISLAGLPETWNTGIYCKLLKTGTFQQKYDKNDFLYHYYRLFNGVMHEKIENLEFGESVNLKFIDLLQNNSPKYLLTSDNLCKEICKSNTFVSFFTARGTSRIDYLIFFNTVSFLEVI